MSLKKLDEELKIRPEKLKKIVPLELVEDAPFDPKRAPHKNLILKVADETVDVVALDEKLQIKKFYFFFICLVSNIVGVLLSLLGLAMTPLFDKYQNNPTLFWCSIIFYMPTFIWLRVLLFPGKDEARMRKYVVQWRNWRKTITREQKRVYLGRGDEEDDDDDDKSIMNFRFKKKKKLTGDSGRSSVTLSFQDGGKKSSIQLERGSEKKYSGSAKAEKEIRPTSILVTSKKSPYESPDKSSKRISFKV